MKSNQKGFASIILVGVIVVLIGKFIGQIKLLKAKYGLILNLG